jgi:hypothetical protein
MSLLLFSCSTQHVVSEHAIQKRKYRPGLFVSNKSKSVVSPTTYQNAELAEELPVPEGRSTEEVETNQNELITANEQKATSETEPTLNLASGNNWVNEDPIEQTKKIMGKFIPMQYAAQIAERAGKFAAKRERDGDSNPSAYIGSFLGLLAIVFMVTGITSAIEGFGFSLMILALALAIIGLVFSIRGAINSRYSSISGTGLSIFGIISNGIVLILSLIIAFFILALSAG